ncbi:MAG: YdcF family protein, partial [Thermodesulfovibrionales bacterium]
AARLHKKLHIPVIISSGQVFADIPSEAPVIRRILMDLDVPADKIILEVRSRDTWENALYSKEICEKQGFRHIILVTSAYHMKRSVLSFRKAGVTVIPFPAAFHTAAGDKDQRWPDYLPSVSAFLDSYAALHEYMGMLFYRRAY